MRSLITFQPNRKHSLIIGTEGTSPESKNREVKYEN